jgi:hypothetical protein
MKNASSYEKEKSSAMKKLLTISIAILLTGTLLSAQTFETERLYQKYRGEEGVISLWIPGVLMKIGAAVADLEYAERALLRSIRSVRLLTIEENELYPGVNFTREAGLTPGRSGYQLMLEVHSDGDDVMILGKEKNGKLRDIIVLVGGSDNVLVHIKGRLNADMVGSLAQIAGKDNGFL